MRALMLLKMSEQVGEPPEQLFAAMDETIKDIDGLSISAADRRQIYEGNARKLLRLNR